MKRGQAVYRQLTGEDMAHAALPVPGDSGNLGLYIWAQYTQELYGVWTLF